MKKIFSVLLCALMLLSCAACAGKDDGRSAVSRDAMEKQTINYYFMTGSMAMCSSSLPKTAI